MKKLIGVIVVLAIVIGAAGYYRGWFSVAWQKGDDGKGQVTGTVDNEKIDADKKRAIEEVKGLGASKATAKPTTTKE